ncbi:MAG: class I SAM-dependent methyltransferase [Oscillospiraceae bacterium]|nr:class I SAM-dependent methyltransferase [Oscillospiraceae bacterium]
MGRTQEKGTANTDAAAGLLVFTGEGGDADAAAALAARLGAAAAPPDPGAGYAGPVLRFCADGVSLAAGGQTLRGDFTRMLPRLRPGNLPHELVVRAAKPKDAGRTPTAFDATAGLGEDSLLLAAAGFAVRLCEYNPVVAALLRDALRRAAGVPALAAAVGRMTLEEADSLTALPLLREPPDVILLDPMFPARQKSALVKKKLQLLQQLERPCGDEGALLDAALAAGARRVIVKRPLRGPCLAGRRPDYALEGKIIRFDCYVRGREGEPADGEPV